MEKHKAVAVEIPVQIIADGEVIKSEVSSSAATTVGDVVFRAKQYMPPGCVTVCKVFVGDSLKLTTDTDKLQSFDCTKMRIELVVKTMGPCKPEKDVKQVSACVGPCDHCLTSRWMNRKCDGNLPCLWCQLLGKVCQKAGHIYGDFTNADLASSTFIVSPIRAEVAALQLTLPMPYSNLNLVESSVDNPVIAIFGRRKKTLPPRAGGYSAVVRIWYLVKLTSNSLRLLEPNKVGNSMAVFCFENRCKQGLLPAAVGTDDWTNMKQSTLLKSWGQSAMAMAVNGKEGDYPSPFFTDEPATVSAPKKKTAEVKKVSEPDAEEASSSASIDSSETSVAQKFGKDPWTLKKEAIRVNSTILFHKKDKVYTGVIKKINDQDGEISYTVSGYAEGGGKKSSFVINDSAIVWNSCPCCELPAAWNVVACDSCNLWYHTKCLDLPDGDEDLEWVCDKCSREADD